MYIAQLRTCLKDLRVENWRLKDEGIGTAVSYVRHEIEIELN